jgi:L-ribulose-5-phosphate 4-epimerase
MSLLQLKHDVLKANLDLPRYGLVTFTWGNASGIDRGAGLVVIKPSGVDYAELDIDDLAVVDLEGRHVQGKLKPSSDLATHLVLYRAFPMLGGVVHTHSTHATAWAQAGKGIPAFGTTHADYFYGEVPCTRPLTESEIHGAYETETGQVIVNTFRERHIDPEQIPAALVCRHGPFAWGSSAKDAVKNAVVLEEVARIAMMMEEITPNCRPIDKQLLDKHYLRRHGARAYYGQAAR